MYRNVKAYFRGRCYHQALRLFGTSLMLQTVFVIDIAFRVKNIILSAQRRKCSS
jgi:hypothetical protein